MLAKHRGLFHMRCLQVRSLLQPLGQDPAAHRDSAPAAEGCQELPSLEGLVRILAESAEQGAAAALARQAQQIGSLQVRGTI